MNRIIETRKKRSMRPRTYLWTLSVLATVSALLYWEQTALLFVISTLAMCSLLLVVALSDLEGGDRELNRQVANDQARQTETGVSKTSSPVLSNQQTIKRHKGAGWQFQICSIAPILLWWANA